MFAPEIASLNMGSMNFGLFPMLNRFKDFKYEWERPYLEGSRDVVFRNTFKDIAYILEKCGDNGTRFECECYDTSHLYNLAYFLDQHLIEPPLFIQSVFGLLGGIGSHPEDIIHMKRTADRLFGDHVWSVLGAGRMQCLSHANHWRPRPRRTRRQSLCGPGKLAQSNAEQVTKIRGIVEDLGLVVALSSEARQMPPQERTVNLNI
jgi:uncharacterized protein (DUF849 family)